MAEAPPQMPPVPTRGMVSVVVQPGKTVAVLTDSMRVVAAGGETIRIHAADAVMLKAAGVVADPAPPEAPQAP